MTFPVVIQQVCDVAPRQDTDRRFIDRIKEALNLARSAFGFFRDIRGHIHKRDFPFFLISKKEVLVDWL